LLLIIVFFREREEETNGETSSIYRDTIPYHTIPYRKIEKSARNDRYDTRANQILAEMARMSLIIAALMMTAASAAKKCALRRK
jgi:hypothetical protein